MVLKCMVIINITRNELTAEIIIFHLFKDMTIYTLIINLLQDIFGKKIQRQ